MPKPPAFQFYTKDWRSSPTVRAMNDHEKAVYIDMLAACWDSEEQGTLPLPLKLSAKVCGRNVRSLVSLLRKFPQTFIEVSGKLVNQKLYEQAESYKRISVERSEAAKQRHANARQEERPAFAPSSSTSNKEVGMNESKEAPAPSQALLQGKPEGCLCRKGSLPCYRCKAESPAPAKAALSEPAMRLISGLAAILGASPVPTWEEYAPKVLEVSPDVEELLSVARLAVADKFWTSRLTGMKSFWKLLTSKNERGLLPWWQAEVRKRELELRPEPYQEPKKEREPRWK